MSGSTVDDMIPSTVGEECSPVATVTGSSSSPPPSLVRQSNGDIATNNNDKGKKGILTLKILTHYRAIYPYWLVSYIKIFNSVCVFLTRFLVSLSRRTLQFETGYARLFAYRLPNCDSHFAYFRTLSTPCSFYS